MKDKYRWPKWLRMYHLDSEPYTARETVVWLTFSVLGTSAFLGLCLLVSHLMGRS